MSNALRRAESVANAPKVPMTRNRLGALDLVKRTSKELGEDHAMAFAGNLTYHALISIFPFAIFLLSLLFLVGQEQLLTDGVNSLRESGALSASAAATVNDQIAGISESRSSALGVGVVVAILTALWGVSGAFRSTMEAMNVMYETAETRGFVRRYVVSIVMSIVVAALFATALALVVGGPAIAGRFGTVGEWTWLVLQWPVLFGFVLLGLALLYYAAPAVEQEFKWVTPGALIAGTLWLVFSIAFSVYVNNFGSYNETYGSLAGVIITLLYLYYSSFIVLFGAEANQVIESASPEAPPEAPRT